MLLCFLLSVEEGELETAQDYVALDRAGGQREMTPYFPTAYAVSASEPLTFNFGLRVLDSLSLPCPINNSRSATAVEFTSTAEAVTYLRREIVEWSAKQQPIVDQPPHQLSKEQLFGDEGEPLARMLASGDASMDRNLDNVRLDR